MPFHYFRMLSSGRTSFIAAVDTSEQVSRPVFAHYLNVRKDAVSKWERGEASPTSYQNALFNQFREASRKPEVRDTLKDILIGAGVAFALALLLSHLMKK